MNVTCLSVRSPFSYLLCAGIKDVENRSWTTDYRGPLYIHSSGKTEVIGMLDCEGLPMPLYNQWYKVCGDELNEETDLIYHDGEQYRIRPEKRIEPGNREQVALINYIVNKQEDGKPFFRSSAIIGKVDLVDIVTDSPSPWAEPNAYHWIINNPIMFKKQLLDIKGKLRLWQYNIQEDLNELGVLNFKEV